jgi:uncharacterized OB-fold protein
MIEFGKPKILESYCPKCGRPIYEGDKGCPKLHKIRPPKIKRYSGKSKSEHKFNNYQ